MGNVLSWLLIGCLIVGLIGHLMPVILFLVGFGLAVLAFAGLAWIVGRIIG